MFESALLLTGPVDRADVARQLSRWVSAGRLVRLRRGLYAFSESEMPGMRRPHPHEIANRLVRGSYVSLTSVLAELGDVSVFVPVTTSVTTGRPGRWDTPLGTFIYRHVKKELFWGYGVRQLDDGERVYVASPEKALIDLLYLNTDCDDPAYLRQLRLQHLDRLRLDVLVTMAERVCVSRVTRAVEWVVAQAAEDEDEWCVVPLTKKGGVT